MRLSLSILTYNRCDQLDVTLSGLVKLSSDIEIIVVDNNSTDNTEKLVKDKYTNIRYIKTPENIGASARNIGILSASGDILIMLDDDIVGITDDDIKLIDKYFSENNELAAINFKVLNHADLQICNWVHHCRQEVFGNSEFRTYEITEGAVAFRKSIVTKVGNYPERFFISHEGPDLAFRIINAGYYLIFTPKIDVIHYHITTGRKKWLNYYYDTRNQIYLAIRNFPILYGIKYLFIGLSSMMIYSIRDGYFKYWFKGIYDGLFGIGWAFETRNVLNNRAMKYLKSIDKNRPSLFYMIKKRFFKSNARL